MEQHVEYRGQMEMQVAVLPARAVYLIKEGSTEGFRRAVQEASTRWGGLTEPIIEVSPDGNVESGYRDVVDVSRVVGAVNVDLLEEQAQEAASQLDLKHVSINCVDRSGITRFTCHPSSTARNESSSAHVLAHQSGNLWEIAAAGDLTDKAFEQAQESRFFVRRRNTVDEIGRAQVGIGSTLLQQTESQAGQYHVKGLPGQMPAVVWLTERDNFDDCIDFWNVRALRPSGFNEPPMVLLPVDELEDWVDFNCQLQSTLFRPMLCNIDVIVISNGVDVDQLEYAARWLGLNPSVENIEVREEWPPPEPRQPPFMCKFNIDVSQFVGFEREYGSIYPVDAQVFRSNSRVRFRSPVRFSGGGRSLLLLSGQPFDGIPRRSIAASLVIRNATWQGDSIQIATNAQNNYNLNFSVPSVEQVRDKILESSVYDYELSDKGKIGRGIQSSSKLSSLLKGGVYEALSELVTPRSKTLMKEIKSCFDDSEITDKMRDLASRWGGRTERIFRPATQFEKVQKDIRPKVAEELCALGWAERGLKVSCPTCNIHSFVPINKADSVASCPGCSSVARYETVPSGPLVFYRLDSFIDLAVDQGVFPHLMVIAALEKSEPLSSFLPGVNLFFDEFGGYVEVDLFGVSGGKVMAGEVKTSVSEFTNERIERDVDLSKNLGVDVHILASVDVVSEDVRGFAQGLCESAGIELYVLDKSQLRPE